MKYVELWKARNEANLKEKTMSKIRNPRAPRRISQEARRNQELDQTVEDYGHLFNRDEVATFVEMDERVYCQRSTRTIYQKHVAKPLATKWTRDGENIARNGAKRTHLMILSKRMPEAWAYHRSESGQEYDLLMVLRRLHEARNR